MNPTAKVMSQSKKRTKEQASLTLSQSQDRAMGVVEEVVECASRQTRKTATRLEYRARKISDTRTVVAGVVDAGAPGEPKVIAVVVEAMLIAEIIAVSTGAMIVMGTTTIMVVVGAVTGARTVIVAAMATKAVATTVVAAVEAANMAISAAEVGTTHVQLAIHLPTRSVSSKPRTSEGFSPHWFKAAGFGRSD